MSGAGAAAPARAKRRWLRPAAAAVLLAVLAVLFHEPVLRAAGEALIQIDPVSPAEAAVLTTDSNAGGALEAADLVARGLVPRVVVFTEPPGPEAPEFARRGAVYEDDGARQLRYLAALGVTAVERLEIGEAGSHPEADALRRWCLDHGVKAVVVVTSPDHSRRLRRMLRRELAPQGIHVTVRPAAFARFDPHAWWKTRTGRRIALVEWQKLLLELVMYPLPA